MSINIRDNSSLLISLLAQGVQTTATLPAVKLQDGVFAGRLDRALQSADQTSDQAKARSMAETLSLQMLHTSLSLVDNSLDQAPQLFDRKSQQLQNFVQAYASNLPGSVPQSAAQNESPSQLSELAETSPNSHHSSDKSASIGNQSTQWLESIISKASNRYGVETGLIKAVIKAESGFNPNAVSHAGAQGLMQLMPGTARSLGVSDSFDPEQNVMAGTRFLRDLLKRYNGNLDSALAAYNWGPGNVDRKPEQLPRETRDYLARVKQLYSSYSA